MNWKRATIATAAVLPVVALLGFGMTRDPREIPSPLPGKPAPQFTLAQLDLSPAATGGQVVPDSVRLSALRGKVVVLNFYASWCLACRDEHPILQMEAPKWEAKGVQFYGVLYKDQPQNIRDWIAEMGGQPYGTLLDPTTHMAINYGLYGVPETFFIGKDGKVARKHVGPVTRAALQQTLDSLLAAPVVATTGGTQ
jgi:cytochrome c biogenesis protein CcmG/thiol:disulfide interchange protein DsbE